MTVGVFKINKRTGGENVKQPLRQGVKKRNEEEERMRGPNPEEQSQEQQREQWRGGKYHRNNSSCSVLKARGPQAQA